MKLPDRLIKKLTMRSLRHMRDHKPDITIGGDAEPYLKRWHVIPRNRLLNVYLHVFNRSDDDRALHDHPLINASILLIGKYIEHSPGRETVRERGDIVLRGPRAAHRIELFTDADGQEQHCTTLFITGYFSAANRGTPGHWDISDGEQRAFAIRGEPGSVHVRDERADKSRPFPRENVLFKSAAVALLWCAEELGYV